MQRRLLQQVIGVALVLIGNETRHDLFAPVLAGEVAINSNLADQCGD